MKFPVENKQNCKYCVATKSIAVPLLPITLLLFAFLEINGFATQFGRWKHSKKNAFFIPCTVSVCVYIRV